MPRGTYPHAATAAKNGTLIAVSTYYLNQVRGGKCSRHYSLPNPPATAPSAWHFCLLKLVVQATALWPTVHMAPSSTGWQALPLSRAPAAAVLQVYNDQTVGVLRQKGTSKVFLFDVLDNGNAIRYNRRVPSIDFRNEVNRFRGDCGADSACGQWRPHGMVFKTVSAPVPVTPRGAACKNNRRGRAARG